jgi:hypothetical protein
MLKEWIELVTGYDSQHVIQANQNGPRPTEPYATFKIISATPSDFSYATAADAGGDEVTRTYFSPAMVLVSVNIYDETGLEKLADLGQSKYLLSVRDIFQADSIVLRNKRETRDLVEIGDTRWRPRYQADFEFAWYNSLAEINQRIYQWEIQGKIENDDVDIIL